MTIYRNFCARLRQLVAHELWAVNLDAQPRWRRFLLRHAQFWALVGREFVGDRCLMHATALAFTTLLAIVPLLALMFAVLKGFGMQSRLAPLLLEQLGVESAAVSAIVTYIDNTQVRHLGAIGLVALVLAVVNLLGNIGKSFNQIWGVEETRPITRRLSAYLSVVTIGPLFVMAAISMTGSLRSQALVQWLMGFELFGEVTLMLFNVLPFVVMWLLFAGLYLVIPNTRVTIQAALVGGVFGGTLWQLSQWLYVEFQVGVARYNAIYGTLAALPILMVWLYISWAIVLFGLEATYATQNLSLARMELRGGRVSITGRARIVLAVLLHLARRFQHGDPPQALNELAAELETPPRLLQGILSQLCQLELVVEVTVRNGTVKYQPGRAPETIGIASLFRELATHGQDYLPAPPGGELAVVADLFARLGRASAAELGQLTLRQMVEQVDAEE